MEEKEGEEMRGKERDKREVKRERRGDRRENYGKGKRGESKEGR